MLKIMVVEDISDINCKTNEGKVHRFAEDILQNYNKAMGLMPQESASSSQCQISTTYKAGRMRSI